VEQQLHILFVTSEVTPFARTGGLSDVSSALPKALAALGHDVRVVMPLYQAVWAGGFALQQCLPDLQLQMPTATRTARVWLHSMPVSDGPQGQLPDVPVYFIEQDDYFARPGLYGNESGDYADNAQRFSFFCRAVLELALRLEGFADVVHCHDWATALLPAYVRFLPALAARFTAVPTVYTIHNLTYQGLFPEWVLPLTGLPPSLFHLDGLEFYGQMSFVKAALHYADYLTTVSPSYAEEICTPEFGVGLDGMLRRRRDVLAGILNGADYDVWNPATDPALAAHYSATDPSSKAICKAALLRTFGLPAAPEVPLLGMISRLVDQKGVDILAAALPALLDLGARLVILGSGEARYQELLTAQAQAYPERLGVRLGFNDALAHQIEAGSDCFLMPSRFEPCGLNQIYSLRYGTIPIIRATGGLRDTVVPFSPATGAGTGFVFHELSAAAFLTAVQQALAVFADRPTWQRLLHNAMVQDFSWRQSALRYVDIYRQAMHGKRGMTAKWPEEQIP
jgi:starch synthase